MSDDSAPGWEAIDAALRQLYGDAEPQHFGTLIKWSIGGPDPLDGVSAYKRDDHWHFVSYGLSELYEKESDDEAVSGYGFELTFRLARQSVDEAPPVWAMNFMQNLARYVFDSGNVFEAGHYLDANGPIASDEPTELTAVCFAQDPELSPIDTPHGSVAFLQIVGVTADEHDAMRRWNSDKFQAIMKVDSPLLLTELSRNCIMGDAGVQQQVSEGIERDGSSMAWLNVSELSWKKRGLIRKSSVAIQIGARAAGEIAAAMTSRVLRGNPFSLIGGEGALSISPAERCRWHEDEDGVLNLEVSPDLANTLAAELLPRAGKYTWPALPGVTIDVVPTEILDRDGKVVKTIG